MKGNLGGGIPILAMGAWRNRTVLSHRKESKDPSPGFGDRLKVTLVKPQPDSFFLAIFQWEQSQDIRKFGVEIPNLAIGSRGEVQFFSIGRKAGSSSVSVADEKRHSRCQGQLDQSCGPQEAKPARPALCSFGVLGPHSVTIAPWSHGPLRVTLTPWLQEAVKCLNGLSMVP